MRLLEFIFTILPIALSPGASFTLAISSIASSGFKGLKKVIVGTSLGILTHSIFAGIGVSLIILSSPLLLKIITVIGSLFLIYLSGIFIISALKQNKMNASDKEVFIKDAYLLNVLNPKAILLYLTIVPGFITSKENILLEFTFLSLIHIMIMSLWLLIVSMTIIFLRNNRFYLVTNIISFIGGLFLFYLAVQQLLLIF